TRRDARGGARSCPCRSNGSSGRGGRSARSSRPFTSGVAEAQVGAGPFPGFSRPLQPGRHQLGATSMPKRGCDASCYTLRMRFRSAVRAVLVTVIAVVGLATVVGLLDRVSWVFELADVFRLQYLVVLVGAALAALVLRRPRLALAAAGFAAVNVAVLGISLI